MPVLKINAQSGNGSGKTVEQVVIELVKQHARTLGTTVTALTDSSGGTNAGAIVAASTALTNSANSASNLASAATATSALGTVVDALRELFTKANAYATVLGIDNVTYNGGGAAVDGTVAAITVATTGATTGAQATNVNAALDAINAAFYQLGVLVNKIAVAQGKAKIGLPVGYDYTGVVDALSTAVGTAADPGVTKASLDAELVKLRANVATVATALNTFRAGNTVATILAV